jgi:MarR family transcriptional regulator, 2-MHQ and catechol-resistance regulon repressor
VRPSRSSGAAPGSTRRSRRVPPAPGGIERDARDLYEALTDLVRLYQFRDRNVICCHDVSVTQCYALQSLVRGGAMTLGALATELYLDKSTASRVVETLERKGFVRRAPHPGDARAIQLVATARGKSLHAGIEASLLDEERRLIAGLSPEVRGAATRLIRDLARATAQRMDVNPPGCCAGTAAP